VTEKRKGPAPGTRGEAANNAGERSPNHTKTEPPGFCLLRYAPPGGKPFHIRLSPAALEMVEALRRAPASRFDLVKRRPRLGLSGPQAIERLRKAGVQIESEWLKGVDRNGRAGSLRSLLPAWARAGGDLCMTSWN
jgi:hypothetical protein